MLTRLQLVVLGVVVFHGAGLNAMDKPVSPRKNLLSCSAELRRKIIALQASRGSDEISRATDLSLKNLDGCGYRDIANSSLAEEALKKNDRRIGWLPI